jgi:2-polyprenyl-3-methyl-5-hydroxy-6-metoxy-1,4-benzoquinol methylase
MDRSDILELSTRSEILPQFRLFEEVCRSGLSAVRPLKQTARDNDPWGWNFGSFWPPSYSAFGRLRALMALAEAVALRPKSVLEVAAGDASLVASLACMGCKVVANDLRVENLEAAVGHFTNAADIEIVPGNLFELDPWSIGSFDLVIACEIVEHVAHTVDFLNHLKKFVNPGGHILLTTPNGSHFRNNLPTYSMVADFTELESRQFQPDADGHLFLLTPAEMASLGTQAGLVIERLVMWGTPLITGHGRLSLLSGKLPSRFCYEFECLAQRLPRAVREKLSLALSVLFGIA